MKKEEVFSVLTKVLLALGISLTAGSITANIVIDAANDNLKDKYKISEKFAEFKEDLENQTIKDFRDGNKTYDQTVEAMNKIDAITEADFVELVAEVDKELKEENDFLKNSQTVSKAATLAGITSMMASIPLFGLKKEEKENLPEQEF